MSDTKGRVNTYLYVAQSLANQAETDAEASRSKTALVGASLGLKQAWEAWLEELSSYLKMPAQEIVDEQSEQALDNPDCQLLFSLKKTTGSWYQQLGSVLEDPLFYYEKALSKGQRGQQSSDESRISIVNVTVHSTGEDAESAEKSLLDVIAEFKSYVQHCREQQTEW